MESNQKKNMRSSTARQVLALLYWRKDNCRSKASALRKAGYSEAVARQPHKVFGSPSLRDELFLSGVGDELSQYQKDRGATLEEWKVQIARDEEKKVQIDTAIKSIPSDQLSLLRKRLMEVGYDPYASVRVREVDILSHIAESSSDEIFGMAQYQRTTGSMANFSSM